MLQSGNISPVCEKHLLYTIEDKIFLVGNLADIIKYATIQDDTFRGYDFTRGRIYHFPIQFCMDLTLVQSYCAACDN